jgi:hypothetical protein
MPGASQWHLCRCQRARTSIGVQYNIHVVQLIETTKFVIHVIVKFVSLVPYPWPPPPPSPIQFAHILPLSLAARWAVSKSAV